MDELTILKWTSLFAWGARLGHWADGPSYHDLVVLLWTNKMLDIILYWFCDILHTCPALSSISLELIEILTGPMSVL